MIYFENVLSHIHAFLKGTLQPEYNTKWFAYKKCQYHSLTKYYIDWLIDQLYRNLRRA